MRSMKVKVISVLEDNYMYLVIEESTRDAVAVDAAVPKRVRAAGAARSAGGTASVCALLALARPFPSSPGLCGVEAAGRAAGTAAIERHRP